MSSETEKKKINYELVAYLSFGIIIGLIGVLFIISIFFNPYYDDLIGFIYLAAIVAFAFLVRSAKKVFGTPSDQEQYFRYMDQGEYDKAIELHEQALQKKPNNLVKWVQLSLAYNEKGDVEKAMSVTKEAIKLFPDDNALLNNLGHFYILLKDFKNAISILEDALEKYPEDSQLYYNLALAYFEIGNLDKAYEAVKLSLSINPSYNITLELQDKIKQSLSNN